MNRLTILIITSLLLFSCNNSGNTENPEGKDSSKTESKTTDMEYTCPMHPEVVRKEVGTCPECGMELQIRS